MGMPFEPQESTHGMNAWVLDSQKTLAEEGQEITRETILWDLAGQTDYQLVHQLFLDDVAVGIVLFDPTGPDSAFQGVELWEKALRRSSHRHPGRRRKLPPGTRL